MKYRFIRFENDLGAIDYLGSYDRPIYVRSMVRYDGKPFSVLSLWPLDYTIPTMAIPTNALRFSSRRVHLRLSRH